MMNIYLIYSLMIIVPLCTCGLLVACLKYVCKMELVVRPWFRGGGMVK